MKDFNIDHLIKEQEPTIPLHILPLLDNKTNNRKIYKILNSSKEKPTGQKKNGINNLKYLVKNGEEFIRMFL